LATLGITASGSISISGCVAVSPLNYGQFKLVSTSQDGAFTACFGPNGLTFPTGARLLYKGLR
jgi:hypothetical protein